MEVSNFLLLICSFEKTFWCNDSVIIVLVDYPQLSSVHSQYSLRGSCLSRSNYFRGEFYVDGAIFLVGNCPGGSFPWGQFSSEAIVLEPLFLMLINPFLNFLIQQVILSANQNVFLERWSWLPTTMLVLYSQIYDKVMGVL